VPTVEPEGLSSPEVLELSAAEGRVLVTAKIRDFEPKDKPHREPRFHDQLPEGSLQIAIA
jgi:hypothetical protein